ncbi:venom factor-like isoform X2 [Dromiciops gliroides]|uniref:venom factor-like isoform X2 n=1 Tax=Dromiciops gliroides TaxID=33562 RepID=UPI001CC3E89B|nr:venom factor-like isoform X2 [Dromiciops gliroides]
MEAPRIPGLSQLLLLVGLPLVHCGPLYLLVAPRVLWVGGPENILLQVHQDPENLLVEPLEVFLTIWDFPLERKLLYNMSLTLSPDNNYMTLAPVTIPDSVVFPPRPGKQYVVLKASSKTFSLMKTIMVAPHAGYIFIQTDKTIYTPEQWVQYRVFTVNHGLDPVMRSFTIDIKNPQGVSVISQNLGEENGFFVGSFHLPELVSFGTWTIEARYQSGPQRPYSVSFDVKEYVLPSFEVQLVPNKTFFYLNDMTLGIDINARYVFNKPVDGHALAIFGVKLDSDWITLQDSLQRVKISEGQGHASLSKVTLTAQFQDLNELLGVSIFVNVTVFSSAGEMVQAETSGVKIVRSPYTIRFTRTPHYFKPGMPFHFGVSVTNPDGSPASGIHVQCEGNKVQTSAKGLGSLTLNTATDSERLSIRVETKDEHLQPHEQAFAELTIQAYKTQENSGNFLHIEVNALETDVGKSLQLSLNTRHENQDTKERIKSFTILLLSKGQITQARIEHRRIGGILTSSLIHVSPELLPSFRILAYYILPGSSPELVADSIWIDVKDTCMGTLQIGLKDSADDGVFEPNTKVNLLLTGDPHALVGLVAVDKAVYALNSKHKLSQKKVWDTVETRDIACTAGSGRDNLGVFMDAGLDLTTSSGMSTGASEDWQCPQTSSSSSSSSSRKRRSLKIVEKKRQKVNEFKMVLERRCCEAGFREGPIGLSCEDRVPWVRHGPACKAAFLQCCKHGAMLDQEARVERLLLGTVRTVFPESWLWRKVKLPKDPARGSSLAAMTIPVNLPDSITTWQIMAVSLRQGKGVCISEPLEMTVRKNFFVDLKLPFSVVRNEQVQIQAILYNYLKRTVKVHVEFPYKKALCSKSSKTQSFFQRVSVPPGSSRVVSFTVLPVEPGNIDVEVQVEGRGVWDQVKKTLLVRAEGQIEKFSYSLLLDPKGLTQKASVQRKVFENMVPGTDADVFVSVQGDILGEPILGALTPSELHKLLTVPTGCPEQTLSSLAPLVILTQYLDATGQWAQVGVERRNQVMDNIVTGYARMLAHRNSNGTFHIHRESPGSTWLTSYVFRIFALAFNSMTKGGMDSDVLCSSAKWLITQRQDEDGSFQEKAPVIVKSMQGGFWGSEAKVSLTALVLIALKEGEILCTSEELNVGASIQRAGAFLEQQLPSLKTVFSVAITSYALALAGSPQANDRLDDFASPDKSHWKVQNDKKSLYTVEATAYALLQKLHLKRHEDIHTIAKWLIERRELGGGFQSTQTTVVALEALIQYRKIIPVSGVSDIQVQIAVPKRSFTVEWHIDRTNAYQLRSQKFSAQDDLIIQASGTGKGTLSVLTIYHKLPDSQKSSCHPFHLNVTLHPDERREGETYHLKIKARYKGPQDATMTILEVSLLTGFYPDEGDLKQLTSNIEMYAFQYETKTSSSNSSVILYLEKLSNQEDIVLSFRIHRLLETELLQAAPVTIINYYEPEERCSVFYNVPGDAVLMRRICHKDVCRCAEEKCPSLTSNYDGINQKELQITACRPGVDFVYKAHLAELEKLDTYVYYTMKILEVIKSGTDTGVLNKSKKFVSHIMCFHALGLKANETYLIMGQSSDLWKTRDEYSYALSMDTFIIKWPEVSDVVLLEFRNELERFSEFLSVRGCES